MAHTPRLENATITVANTNVNGTGTIVTVATGANAGSRIDLVMVQAIVPTTEGIVRFFTKEAAGVWRLLLEIPVSPSSGIASNPLWSTPVRLPAFYLGHNQEFGASTQNAESFTITAMCLDAE